MVYYINEFKDISYMSISPLEWRLHELDYLKDLSLFYVGVAGISYELCC
jgi:hypothetical protein